MKTSEQFMPWAGKRSNDVRRHIARVIVGCAALFFTIPSVLVGAVQDAEEAVRKKDLAGAIGILEKATIDGDQAAKATLASYLRSFPPPYGDAARACKLAREASDAGEPIGVITRADCLIAGIEKAEQPFGLARELTRNAWKAGSSAGGFALYLVYAQDPRYRYIENGTANKAKYDELAAMPVSDRGEQIEAFEGLASAMRAGHINAALMAISYLGDSAAPNNVNRILNLTNLLQTQGVSIPPRMQGVPNIAR